MAKKNDIPQIVDFFGAILQGRSASIFMKYMAGKKKNTSSITWLPFSSYTEPVEVQSSSLFCNSQGSHVISATQFAHIICELHKSMSHAMLKQLVHG